MCAALRSVSPLYTQTRSVQKGAAAALGSSAHRRVEDRMHMWVCVWLIFRWVEWLSLPGTPGKPVKERKISLKKNPFTRFWTAGERGKILHTSLSLSYVGPSRSLWITLCLFSRCWQLSQHKTHTLHILQTLVYREEIERKLCRKTLSFFLSISYCKKKSFWCTTKRWLKVFC